jgi:SpoVK/Ycf46/Vps4 family AAA+-type ATPase
VNSHSLFSKWFSESGKLVMKLFSHISEIAEDEQCMVVVLIDEVESITASRGSAARSNEPGDAVRVVNAVLTSLDALKRRPNVLVLCTSNLIASVDPVGILCYDTYRTCTPYVQSLRFAGFSRQSGHEGAPAAASSAS